MVSKWAQDEKRRRKAERAAELTPNEREMLELMGKLRVYVGGCELIPGRRAEASHALWLQIESLAEVITGKPRYFWDVRNPTGD